LEKYYVKAALATLGRRCEDNNENMEEKKK
jgi:hypothetical protein